MTVDHGLRAGSAAEADFVGDTARRLGLGHRTLRWDGPKPVAGLQGEARQARYDLLVEAARDLGAAAVMTAHHEDDQIETHFLAALRNAGDRGLAGMRPARDLAPGLVLLRPFLGVPAARLRRMLAEAGQEAIDDPSNHDRRFERVRVRQALAAGGVDRGVVLARIAEHRARRDDADTRLAKGLSRLIEDGGFSVDGQGVARLGRHALSGMEAEDANEFLARILAAVAGRPYPPSREAIDRLRTRLLSAASAGGTLGGVFVDPGGAIRFSREFGRSGPQAVRLPANRRSLLFDGRFDVTPRGGHGDSPGMLVPLGYLGRGNAGERTLPVLVGPGEAPIAAHPDLLPKFPGNVVALDLCERVSWRCFADLAVRRA